MTGEYRGALDEDQAAQLERVYRRNLRRERLREAQFWAALLGFGGGLFYGGAHMNESTRHLPVFLALVATIAGFLGLVFRR